MSKKNNPNNALAQLSELISAQAIHQAYYLSSCGHVSQAPGRNAPSGLVLYCPVCQKQASMQRFEELSLLRDIEEALAILSQCEQEIALSHISQQLEKIPLENCVRDAQGELLDINKLDQASSEPVLSLTPKERTQLKRIKTVLANSNSCNTAITETHLNACIAYNAPAEKISQSIRTAMYRQLMRFHKMRLTPSTLQVTAEYHRTMIKQLQRMNEAAATIYAQCAHEQLREATFIPADIQTECSISLDSFKQPIYTDCGHLFEKSHIKSWLKNHSTCPCCRTTVNALVEVPLRTSIARNIQNKTALQKLIAPYHTHWPYVLTTALYSTHVAHKVVWSKTETVNIDNIRNALNKDIENLSHAFHSNAPKPAPKRNKSLISSCCFSLFNTKRRQPSASMTTTAFASTL